MRLQGSLSFEIDLDNNIATLIEFDVVVGQNPFPSLNGSPVTGISGTIDSATSTLSFSEPASTGSLSWTFSPLGSNPGDQISWLGIFSDGFVDGFNYEFREGTPGSGGPGGGGPTGPSGPATLVLVPEPSAALLVGLGLVALGSRTLRHEFPQELIVS